LHPEHITPDGALHKCKHGTDKHDHTGAGYYGLYLNDNRPAGFYGSHRGMPTVNWSYGGKDSLDPIEWEQIKADIAKSNAEHNEAKAKKQKEGAKAAVQRWEQAQPCKTHPFTFIRKAYAHTVLEWPETRFF